MPRTVFFKQSGERLAKGGELGEVISAAGARAVGEKLQRAHILRHELDVAGLTVVSGAGNIVRGDRLRDQGIADELADPAGRLATTINTMMIASQLKAHNVPYVALLTEKMKIEDPGFKPAPYSVDRVQQAHDDGRVVLIAGGTGEDNVSTDHAVAWYAQDYSSCSDSEVMILKGTQYDGVYEGDPRERADAPRYRIIGAQHMLDNYERYKAVDRPSLELLVQSSLAMVVYADGAHDLETVLRHSPTIESNGLSIGTLIVANDIAPVPYPTAA